MNFKTLQKYTLGQKRIGIFITLTIIALLLALNTVNQRGSEDVASSDMSPLVTLITPQEYAGAVNLSIIGSVRAVSEAAITPERGGRITSVPVKLGQNVSAGQIIATMENASERAALLQAEGVYDAAAAAASLTGFGVNEAEIRLVSAEQRAVSTARSVYTTVNSVIVSNVDKFFSNPNSTIPGLRVSGRGYTQDLNKERVAYQALLQTWQIRVNSLTTDHDLQTELDFAKENVERTIEILDIFLFIFNEERGETYAADEVLFTNLRSSLLNTLTEINAVKNELTSAADALVRASTSATGGTASAADAQVKQAQGALQAAQANLAKTILRSPISGTVNSLTVRSGEYISAFSPVAVVINDRALEILTSVSEEERKLVTIGDEVTINSKSTGIITAIAPALNTATGKFEVRITTDGSEITAGETVRISKTINTPADSDLDSIKIPLSAVKFAATDGFVFTVEDEKLRALPITIGAVRGSTIEITSGLTPTDAIVRDVRGLNEGESVTVQK